MDPKCFVYLAISGEQVRGSPGCVLVDQEQQSAAYTLVSELEPAAMREKIANLIERDDEEHYFFLFRTKTNVHVLKHRREEARRDFAQQAGMLLGGAPETSD